MANFFGTDGIRQAADHELLSDKFLRRLGAATGKFLKAVNPERKSLSIVIGKDPRSSGGRIAHAIMQGLATEDIRVFDAGVVPTPAIAQAVIDLDLPLGIMITASHNPAEDNGVKFFGPGGMKLSEEVESKLEGCIAEEKENHSKTFPKVMLYDARRHYLDKLSTILPANCLMGYRIVIDCANGATCRTSPELLETYGAQVIKIGCEPNGNNINENTGSEHTENLQKAVIQHKADLGIAHDGDGDRLILVDENGEVVDGDAVLSILGTQWQTEGRLKGGSLVSTVMSNMGLDAALNKVGAKLFRSQVGDRNVFYDMQRLEASLGGEASGHFIAIDYLPTGDGLLAALLVLEQSVKSSNSLSKLSSCYRPFPQYKKNLPVLSKPAFDEVGGLQTALNVLNEELGSEGRVLLRYSGTESKVRLLAESESDKLATSTMNKLEEIVRTYLPLK